MMLGLHRPDEGTISVFGADPFQAGAGVRARIGYAPEHDALPPDVTAIDLVRHIAEIHGLPFREATGRASDALYQVGLGEERFRPVGTFSTGQRQRVKLAQAIVHDPLLILLDEPTNGLDPVQRDEMLTLIRRIGHDLGLDVVLSSHLLDEVERVSDAVVILDAGRTVIGGQLDDLRAGAAAEEQLVVVVDASAELRATVAAAIIAKGCRLLAVTGSGLDLGQETTVEGTIGIALDRPEVYDLVRDALAETGAAVRRIQRRTRTLEDVFLMASGTTE